MKMNARRKLHVGGSGCFCLAVFGNYYAYKHVFALRASKG